MNSATENSSRLSSASLTESRNASRTLGCVGASVVAHAALLAALALNPAAVRNLSEGTSKATADDTVSMIDTTGDTTAGTTVDAEKVQAPRNTPVVVDQPADSIRTDSSSAIVNDQPEDETKQVPKPVVKKAVSPTTKPITVKSVPVAPPTTTAAAATTAAAPVMTDDASDAEPMPKLLANPPSDDETPSPETSQQDEAQDVAAAPVQTVKPATVAATAEDLEPAPFGKDGEPEVTSAPIAAVPTGTAPSNRETSAHESGSDSSAGSVVGPIRDASELKALPGNSNPVYPPRDRLARKEGTAVILARVSPDGRITELKLEKSSGSANMDAAAMQTFRSWRFQAGQEGWVRKPFQFRLVGATKEIPAALGQPLQR